MQYRAVQRANGGNIQGGGFLQQGLHRRTVFANDIDKVAAGFLRPRLVRAYGAEFAKGVCAKEHLFRLFVADHHLRPVHHGCHHKGQGVVTQLQRIALFHRQGLGVCWQVKKLGQHSQRLGAEHQGGFGIFLYGHLQTAGVVRL